MKPLVFYCRWQGVSLRLRGRDETAVWGHLVQKDQEDNDENSQEFKFDLKTWELTLKGVEKDEVIKLDEKGVVLS